MVITMSTIASPLRRFLPPPIGFRGLDEDNPGRPVMLGCALCTGCWVGVGAGVAALRRGLVESWWDVVGFAFAAALVSYVAATWLREHDRH